MTDLASLHDFSRSKAILMGTWDYEILKSVPAVEYSLRRMKQVLTSPLCGWPEDRILEIGNAARPDNMAVTLIKEFADTEIALFYFVGHGLRDENEDLCMGLRETVPDTLYLTDTSLPFAAVRRALLASKAATKIVILDCCFAGTANHPDNSLNLAAPSVTGETSQSLLDAAYRTGAYTMAAAGPATKAWYEDADSGVRHPQTFFTKYLADVISGGIPGQPALLNIHAVFLETQQRLYADGKPVPLPRNVGNAADFVFAHNAAPRETHIDYLAELERERKRREKAEAQQAEAEARKAEAEAELARIRKIKSSPIPAWRGGRAPEASTPAPARHLPCEHLPY